MKKRTIVINEIHLPILPNLTPPPCKRRKEEVKKKNLFSGGGGGKKSPTLESPVPYFFLLPSPPSLLPHHDAVHLNKKLERSLRRWPLIVKSIRTLIAEQEFDESGLKFRVKKRHGGGFARGFIKSFSRKP